MPEFEVNNDNASKSDLSIQHFQPGIKINLIPNYLPYKYVP